MKILLDSASVADVRWAADHGLADGIVVTPTALAAERAGDAAAHRELLGELARALPAPVYASVASVDPADMYRDGRELARIADNVVVQVPLVDDAVGAVRRLAGEGVRVSATLVFSAPQALLASKAGATSVVVPLRQLEALGQEAAPAVRDVRRLFDRGEVECDLIAAHPSSGAGFTAAAVAGADALVVDARTLRALLVHPLTDRGVDAFLQELAARGRPRIAPA
jgi:transaldolase